MSEPQAKDPLIGLVIKDAYRIERLVADGGTSMVYLAEQLSLNRYIALKVLRPGFDDEDFIQLFLREARVYSQINHPNVVSVIDFGRAEGIVYMAMEYMDGGTLSDIVKHKGLSLANILWVMEQVCAGVFAAHKLDIIHRDIKPSNIMVCKLSGDTTVAKVLDFGISKPLHENDLKHTRMGMVMGTPGFIAPEQIAGARDMDARVDVYALGAILYYLVTGTKPYGGSSLEIIMNRQLSQPPEALQQDKLFDADTLKLQPVIFKAMTIKRENRYPDVITFWQDVLNHASAMKNIQPASDVANQPLASRYHYIFKGELAPNGDKKKVKQALMHLLKLESTQVDKLFSKSRVVVGKDLPHAKVKRIDAIFKKAGAIGYIEEMDDATHFIPTGQKPSDIPASLPSSSLVKPILASDIPNVTHKPERPPSSVSISAHSFSFSGTDISASQVVNDVQDNAQQSSQGSSTAWFASAPLKYTIAASVLLITFAVSSWFILPARYSMMDLWHYTVQGHEQPRGITRDEIKLGISAAFSGSARELGQSMRNGINAYFMQVNDAGGIHGRKISLLSLDDGYEPQAALTNVNIFSKQDSGVFAMLGNVGTPTAKVILPQALEQKFLVFGTFSGASILRNNPPDRYVFNYRASYAEETAALIDYFVDIEKVNPRNIAVFYQADSFGHDGLEGVKNALRRFNIAPNEILQASYQRNTTQIEDAVSSFQPEMENIEAFVLISTYAASASFTQAVRNLGYRGKFANVSFVGSRALVERLQENGVDPEGILISQVVPPFTSYATGVLNYRDAMEKYFPGEQQGFISLEGYIVATLFVEGLKKSGRYFTTESFINTLETIKELDLGLGELLSFGASNHQASHHVWGSMINAKGEFEAIKLNENQIIHEHQKVNPN
ncbi:Serine/threonine-protein kinase PK-1 [Thalassocella blandensis]|nr:Serine/threonine-protein kinase PK-1 [Thalassocella blandensis]